MHIEQFFNEEFGNLTTQTSDGKIFYKAADVAKIIGLQNAAHMTDALDADEKIKLKEENAIGPERLYVTESGLYHAIFNANPNMAVGLSQEEKEQRFALLDKFKKWVEKDVAPSVVKHGGYIQDQEKLAPEDLKFLTGKIQTLSVQIVDYANELAKNNAELEQVGDRLDAEEEVQELYAKNQDVMKSAQTAIDNAPQVVTANAIFKSIMGNIQFYQDLNGESYVDAGELAKQLHYGRTSHMLENLNTDEYSIVDGRARVTEAGVYHALFNVRPAKSNVLSDEEKDARIAEVSQFRRKFTEVVLPSVRKFGGYIEGMEYLPEQVKEGLNKEKLEAYVGELDGWVSKMVELNKDQEFIIEQIEAARNPDNGYRAESDEMVFGQMEEQDGTDLDFTDYGNGEEPLDDEWDEPEEDEEEY